MRTRLAYSFAVSLAGLLGVGEFAKGTNVSIKVCGGFTDGGLENDDCCYNEAFGIHFAKIVWDRGILPRPAGDVNLLLNYVDTEGDPGSAISCAFSGWQTENSALVLGGGWSSLTKPMAQLGGSLGGAQLDWGGTSDELSDAKVYPLLSRTAAPDASIAIGLAELLVQQYLSSRVIVIHETGDWGQTLTTKLTEQLYNLSPNIDLKLVPLMLKPSAGDEAVLRAKFAQLKGKMYRHFVVISLEPVTFEVLAEDEFSYIVGPSTFLLGPGDVTMGMNGISSASLAKFAGMQILQSGSDDIGRNFTLLSNLWMNLTANDFPEPLRTILPCRGGATSAKVDCWWGGQAIFSNNDMMSDPYFTLAFDAAWLLQVALQSLATSGKSAAEMRGSTLHDALLRTSSVGLTGRIILRGNGDRVLSSFNLKYLDSTGVWRLAGNFDSVLKSLTIVQDPIYADSSTMRPADSFRPCSPGQFRNGTMCTAAPPGFYVPVGVVLGAALECTKGTFANGSGNALCSECSPGRYQNSTGQSECQDCPELFYTKSSRQFVCKACPEGHVQAEGGTGCLRCKQGTYRSATDQSCVQCPVGTTTAFMAATDPADCQCEPGTFQPVGNGSCKACLEGMVCEFGSSAQNFKVYGGSDVNIPLLEPGYYSDADKPLSIYRCIDANACPGGVPATCDGQRNGLVCARCPDSHVVNTQTGECSKCPEAMPVIVAFLPFLMLVAITLSYYAGNSDLTVNASILLTCSVAGGIIICSCQVLSVFRLLSIPWPRSSFDGLDVFSFMGLDVNTISPECTFGDDATVLYLLRILVPIVFVLMVFLLFGVVNFMALQCKFKPWTFDKVLNTIGQILQMLFIAFAVIVVRPFECYAHPNGESSVYLFPQVLCWSSEHAPLVVLAALETVFLLIPYAAVCIWANHKAPQIAAADSGDRRNLKFLIRFRFLLYRFRPDIWWWGNAFLLRQALLAFASSLPSNDPHGQIIYIVFTLAVYSTGLIYCWPWKNHILNILDMGSTLTLQLIIVVATTFVPKSPNGSTYAAISTLLICILGAYITGFVAVVLLNVIRYGPFADFEDYSVKKRKSEDLAAKFFKCSETLVMMGSTKIETMVRLMNGHDRGVMWNALIIWQSVLSDFLSPGQKDNLSFGEEYKAARLSHCRYGTSNSDVDVGKFEKSMTNWNFQEHAVNVSHDKLKKESCEEATVKDAKLEASTHPNGQVCEEAPCVKSPDSPSKLLDWTDVWPEGPRMCPRGSPRFHVGALRGSRPAPPYTPGASPEITSRGLGDMRPRPVTPPQTASRGEALAVTPQASPQHRHRVTPQTSQRTLRQKRPVTPVATPVGNERIA